MKRMTVFILSGVFIAIAMMAAPQSGLGKKKFHPYDIYSHEVHTPRFESAKLTCEACHANPDSYADRKKVNRLGCHICHKDPNPPMPAPRDCAMCHPDGIPKPNSHKINWMARHQIEAKSAPHQCDECHKDQMFCIDCHKRRDTVQERVHKRNFLFSHSIVARANPRRCDQCHVVEYCQNCHQGRGNSSK